MPSIRREIWGYAVLLVILFSIASVAVWETISFFQSAIASSPDDIIFPIVMWSLTLGFMLIAGAYGLWAMKFSAQSESRRRIGRFVDAMDYFPDGLILVDRSGNIAGSNPVVATITGNAGKKGASFAEVYPYISQHDVDLLINSDIPVELEASAIVSGSHKTFRFRSQPSEDMKVVAISDVTSLNVERVYNRQKARLQLVGHLSRGMANDFNRLLCEISAHASLLQRVQPGSIEMNKALEALKRNVESGIALAGNLLGLSQPDPSAQFTDSIEFHLQRTADLLRNSLPAGWQIDVTIQDDIPAIGLTGIQIEQVIFNLGGMAADATRAPGIMKIAAIKPGQNYSADAGNHYAALIVVTTSSSDVAAIASQHAAPSTYGDSGIILSVIKSILDEAGGSIDYLTSADGAPVYRVGLPHGSLPKTTTADSSELADELKSYISQWSIVLAGPLKELAPIQKQLTTIGSKIESIDNIMSLLSRIEEEKTLDTMVISKQLLGQETKGILKAILKLRPSAGIVVLCEDPATESAGLSNDIIFESSRSNASRILSALLEAKSLTASRKQRLPR